MQKYIKFIFKINSTKRKSPYRNTFQNILNLSYKINNIEKILHVGVQFRKYKIRVQLKYNLKYFMKFGKKDKYKYRNTIYKYVIFGLKI